eukprot:GHRR01012835.1.p1 GENE.GHRR01012835.1~~GHRR01012835.1.p1  ORF type:complete len:201 (+),score=94.46 GHRR01012835.1:1252-1854(+)
MHYVQGLVTQHMAAVHHLLENNTQQAECYAAQQKDMQCMCKTLPQHPLGYTLFARCAMNAQQMSLAAAFLQKGLLFAQATNDDTGQAIMPYQQAAALLLGGVGKTFHAAAVQQLLQQGAAAVESVLRWFPDVWNAHAVDGEPDKTLVLQKLLPAWEERHGGPLPAEGGAEALQGLLYVIESPTLLPPGALMHVGGGAPAE